MKRAKINGVNDLSLLNSNDVHKLEPDINCIKAILSPATGVFDSSIYVQNLVSDIESNHGNLIYNCNVDRIIKNDSNLFEILTNQGSIESDIVINAAGMYAPYLASKIDQYPIKRIPKQYYSKGNYFKIENGKKPTFKRLIYPIPSNGGLGIHATIDMNNNVKFGPDSEWLIPTTPYHDQDSIDHEYIFTEPPPISSFQVDIERSKLFYEAIKKYWPAISESHHSLTPDFSGIRPQLCGPSSKVDFDFVIESESHHNIKNLINLYGIASPGLTSSLAISRYVKQILFDY
jgi:L-2-hydroxyglutarate oxidase LhgO